MAATWLQRRLIIAAGASFRRSREGYSLSFLGHSARLRVLVPAPAGCMARLRVLVPIRKDQAEMIEENRVTRKKRILSIRHQRINETKRIKQAGTSCQVVTFAQPSPSSSLEPLGRRRPAMGRCMGSPGAMGTTSSNTMERSERSKERPKDESTDPQPSRAVKHVQAKHRQPDDIIFGFYEQARFPQSGQADPVQAGPQPSRAVVRPQPDDVVLRLDPYCVDTA